MRPVLFLAVLAGIALITLLVTHFGVAEIGEAIVSLGWGGFAAIVLFHVGLLSFLGLGWWLLGRDRPEAHPRAFVWGRLMRDSSAETLPISALGGFVLGARALALAGISGMFAAASTVVDVTAEVVSQLCYVLIGLGLLGWLKPANRLILPMLAGAAGMALLAGLFIAVQSRGIGPLERLGTRFAQRWLGSRPASAGALRAELRRLHDRHGAILGCVTIHLLAWTLSGVEAWLTLRLMGASIGLASAIVIDSLLYGIRSAFFMVPNALGVQEGAYVMLGALVGLGPELALALSLIRRGRDITIGIPVLFAWQWVEGKRAWQGISSPTR